MQLSNNYSSSYEILPSGVLVKAKFPLTDRISSSYIPTVKKQFFVNFLTQNFLQEEEPEIYQHSNRQRHLASILLKLAQGKTPGVAEKTQILYSTHSPLFVGIDRINQIRLLRKHPNDGDKPKVTKIISTDTGKLAEEIWKAEGKPEQKFTAEAILSRLQTINDPLDERRLLRRSGCPGRG